MGHAARPNWIGPCLRPMKETGVVLNELDKIGCGVAYGKVATIPVDFVKPIPKLQGRHLTFLLSKVDRVCLINTHIVCTIQQCSI